MKNFLCFAATVCLTLSCSVPKEKEVTVSNVEITGTINGWAKVVDGTYHFANNGDEAYITIEFEMIEQPYGEVEFVIKP